MMLALGDRDPVNRAVELAVAATVEAMPRPLSRGGRDRSDPGDPGKLRIGGEPPGASDLRDQLRRGERRAPRQLKQLRRIALHQDPDLALELPRSAGAAADLDHQLAGDPNAGGLLGAG